MSKDWKFTSAIGFLLTLSAVILNSIAGNLFPLYFVYMLAGVLLFLFFSQIEFDILELFSKHFYVISIILLLITLIIGQVTRGTIRWIPIGGITLQPAELVRPFLLVFFSVLITSKSLNWIRFIKSGLLLMIPVGLILIQPSLGVSILTVVGFLGILLAGKFDKKYILFGIFVFILAIPILVNFMAPYQKARIASFLHPDADPQGAGYNSFQSVIAAGSGKLLGRGLGRGVQTQLAFLPEKQTDFIFSAVSEELGFLGASFLLVATLVVLLSLIKFMESAQSPAARAYLAGFTLTYMVQVFIHVGMNMGILPVTGLPYPLMSAGGSSLLGTMIALGIAVGAYKK